MNGMGFAAVRDFNSFLRYARKTISARQSARGRRHAHLHRNLVATGPARSTTSASRLQRGRERQKVFDGMMQWVAAGDGINMNYRWSQTRRTERNRQDQLYLEGLFPFANQTTVRPDLRADRRPLQEVRATNTCPLAMEFYSANEYWVKAASLFHTDPTGKVDLPDHPQARLYLLSSKQHGGAGQSDIQGNCQQFLNPLDSAPVQRALWEDLDQWSTRGKKPPPLAGSEASGWDARAAAAAGKVGFPKIPGVTYTGLKTTRYRFNYGPNFYADRHPDDQPAGHHAAVRGQSGERPDLSELRAEDRHGRQRHRRHPPAGIDGAARDLHRMGAACGRPQANDGCEGSGQYIPFKADEGRTHGRRAIRVCRSRSAITPSECIAARSSARSMIWCAIGSCFARMPPTSSRACFRQGWMRECQRRTGTHLRKTRCRHATARKAKVVVRPAGEPVLREGGGDCSMPPTSSVRYWHKADIGLCAAYVRFWGKSGHRAK